MSKVICPCKDVTKKDIKEAIKDGATTFKDLKKETKIASGCGKCKKRAKKTFKKLLKKSKQ